MSAINLAPREHEMLLALGKYINTTAVDWDSMAKDLNYKSAKACRDKWYPLRYKLFGKQTAGNGVTTPAGSAKKKATPGKRKSVADDSGDDEEATPSKKVSRKGKKADTPAEDTDDEKTASKSSRVKAEPTEHDIDLDQDLL